MGKLSTIMIFLLMINIVGYIVLTQAGDANNPYITGNSILKTLYTAPANVTPTSGAVSPTFALDSSTGLSESVPTEGTDSFFSSATNFIDRILVVFKFIRVIFAFLFVPAVLFGYGLALPWEATLLLGVPLATLYIVGIIDLIGGGDS
jgi:hypothetical protein